MGLVGHESYAQFWTPGDRNYYKQIQDALSLRRYEALQQFFHITPPERPTDDTPPEDLLPEASYRSVPERLKKLYKRLRSEGIGAHSTANTSALAEVHPELAGLKYNTKMPGWGSFKAIHEDGVLQICWQDSVPTLFMSIVDSASKVVKKDRWRPPKASSKAAMEDWERQGEPASNRLGHRRVDLPTFADRYNHNMNAVDVANQLRDAYTTRRPH
ncbi:hypothetical protein SLS57_006211 [Botryosphaeria dothidea]